MNMKRQNRGFTLLELMTVIAVVAVLTTIAAPSFKRMIDNSRQTTAVNEFIRAVYAARSEAAKRGTTVRLTAIDALDGGTLSDTNEWGKGWEVWQDSSDSGTVGTLDPGEEIMVFKDIPSTLTFESDSDTVEIRFSPTGRIKLLDSASTEIGTNTEFLRVCDDRTGEDGKKIQISTVGQPSTDTVACP